VLVGDNYESQALSFLSAMDLKHIHGLQGSLRSASQEESGLEGELQMAVMEGTQRTPI